VIAMKIGDSVRSADVPDGAMVRIEQGAESWHFIKLGGMGEVVEHRGRWWPAALTTIGQQPWYTLMPYANAPVIAALGLTGQESADDLRALALLGKGEVSK